MTALHLLKSPRTMVRLTALVPLKDNGGRPFPPDYYLVLQQFLLRRANGMQEHSVIFGRWANTHGTVVTDDCVPFVVTCAPDVAARVQTALDLLIRTLFEQQAAYVEAVDVRITRLDAAS